MQTWRLATTPRCHACSRSRRSGSASRSDGTRRAGRVKCSKSWLGLRAFGSEIFGSRRSQETESGGSWPNLEPARTKSRDPRAARMKPELRVALLGQGFMGKAHSNAYCQVEHFFDLPYRIRRKVICGRDAASLAAMADRWGWEET